MAYDIDQCAQCGGIRVSKSTLCADCLVTFNHRLRAKDKLNEIKLQNYEYNAVLLIKKKDEEIRELKYQLRIRWKLLQKIFMEYQDLLRLYKRDGMKLDAVNRVFR